MVRSCQRIAQQWCSELDVRADVPPLERRIPTLLSLELSELSLARRNFLGPTSRNASCGNTAIRNKLTRVAADG